MTTDPYEINIEKNKKAKEEIDGKQTAEFCPKRNKTIGGECKVCDEVQALFKTQDKEDRDKAYKLMASTTIHMCAVLPANPEKLLLLELGKTVGSAIMNGVNAFGWTDIAHPLKGKGRCMMVTKGNNGKHNTYNAARDGDKADWSIPKSVIERLPDLSTDIIDILQHPEKYDITLYRVASEIKMDETIKFRICPPKDPSKLPWVPVYRHWGVSKAQIEGETPLHVDTEDKPFEDDVPDSIFEEKVEEKLETKSEEATKPKCFGKEITFDETDAECQACAFMKSCAKAVMKGQ